MTRYITKELFLAAQTCPTLGWSHANGLVPKEQHGGNELRREMVKVITKYGEIEVKRSYYGGKVVNEKPEFEQCRKLAGEHHVTLEEIRKEVYKKL